MLFFSNIVLLKIYFKKIIFLNLDWTSCKLITNHYKSAGGVYDDVFLCCPFPHEISKADVLDGIFDLIKSVSEGFHTYS